MHKHWCPDCEEWWDCDGKDCTQDKEMICLWCGTSPEEQERMR